MDDKQINPFVNAAMKAEKKLGRRINLEEASEIWQSCLDANGTGSGHRFQVFPSDRDEWIKMRKLFDSHFHIEEDKRYPCACAKTHEGPAENGYEVMSSKPDDVGNQRVTLEMEVRDLPGPEKVGAPAWVVEMMRTGQPVLCRVGRNIVPYRLLLMKTEFKSIHVTGYDLKSRFFIDIDGQHWDHAEPLSSWTPKEGEAVLYCYYDDDGDPVGCLGVFSGGKIYHGTRVISVDVGMKPFDAYKIGKPWSEIVG